VIAIKFDKLGRRRGTGMLGKKHSEETKKKISQSERGKIVSSETKEKHKKRMLGQKNEKSIAWSGDKVGYYGIHDWLFSNFGKANECENIWCLGDKEKFHWAKLENRKYERKRDNFIQLCVKCHVRYDRGYRIKLK